MITPLLTTPQRPIGSGFGARSTADEVLRGIDLSGKLALVTGGCSGIGLETTRSPVKAGARAMVPARRPETAEEALAGIEGVEADRLDLADPGSVRDFAGRFLATGRGIDIVINSTAVMALPGDPGRPRPGGPAVDAAGPAHRRRRRRELRRPGPGRPGAIP